MPELSLDWAIALVLILTLALSVAMVVMYRLRAEAETRRRTELRGSLSQMLKRRAELAPPPKMLVAALGRVTNSVEKAAGSKRTVVKVRLHPDIELKAVASDILMLRMPTADGWATLHKSFENVRIRNVKKISRGYELHISST
jgi:hypothetical protein